MTIKKAYDELEKEGYLKSIQGKGRQLQIKDYLQENMLETEGNVIFNTIIM